MNYTKGGWRYDGKGLIHIEGDLGYAGGKTEIAVALRPTWMSEDAQEANAHLIAAAPEMYEALKLACEILRARGEVGIAVFCEKAIIKAERRESK